MRIHLLVDKQVVHADGTHDLYFNITADDGRRFRVKTDIRCEQKPVGLLFARGERNSVAKSARLRELYDQIEEFGLQNPRMRSDRLKDAVLMIVLTTGIAIAARIARIAITTTNSTSVKPFLLFFVIAFVMFTFSLKTPFFYRRIFPLMV